MTNQMLLTNPGFHLILISLFLNIVNIFTNLLLPNNKINFFTQTTQYICVILSFAFLVYNLVALDFHYAAVTLNSSSLMPIIYRISGAWSGHDTSILFFLFTNSIVFLLFAFGYYYDLDQDVATNKLNKDLKSNIESTILCQKIYKLTYLINNLITFVVKIYVICYANPFIKFSGSTKDGLGMNPLLQDFAMAIHPPVLFFAYSIMQLQYSLNLASLYISPVYTPKILGFISKASLAFITLAIGLGSWWAYRELGWGGYWFFDPVENLSLITWIFSFLYHHFLLTYQNSVATKLLGMSSLISIYLGTYVIRADLINSVHSFASSYGTLMLLILGLALCIPVIYYFGCLTRRKANYLICSSYLWFLSIFIIINSIIIPIILGGDIEITPVFFHYTLVPIMLLACIFNGLTSIISLRHNIILLLAHIPIIFFSALVLKSSYLVSLGYFTGIYMIISAFCNNLIYTKGRLAGKLGKIFGHSCVGLLIFSISYNNHFIISKNITLELHQEKNIDDGIAIKLNGIKYENGVNYINQKIEILLQDKNYLLKLTPELRYYPIEHSLSSEVAIYSTGLSEWYCIINNIDNEIVSVNLMKQEGIKLIWLSILLCVFAMIIQPVKLQNASFE
ncbi:MAG: cytochrome c-type biogenesis CcmF C-terminal domain-containing protein [Rickettsiaceae bacterium]|nr:cytochrome c-type biogenesis CcmF C-terminal domain-containing protein [Rickettsiaceae bacterium]